VCTFTIIPPTPGAAPRCALTPAGDRLRLAGLSALGGHVVWALQGPPAAGKATAAHDLARLLGRFLAGVRPYPLSPPPPADAEDRMVNLRNCDLHLLFSRENK